MLSFQSFLDFWKYDPGRPMVFTSKDFLLLFVLFLVIYNIIRKRFSARVIYVTLFSLYFYYLSSGWYFFILILMSLSDFTIGYYLSRQKRRRPRDLLLTLSLVIDLGILFYFKYTNFFIEIFSDLFNKPLELRTIFLPVGISFFTFQSLSYIIDIYRRQIEPASRWIDYLFYLSFFPQLVAGPIIRAKDFLPQVQRRPVPTREMTDYGFYLIILGVVKKVFIADYIAVNFVDRVFDTPTLYTGFENLMGIYGYTLQIYCDFSGYSDIAIGIAFLLGFQFLENFRMPYRSATVTEFWRRWHISLSSWLKDYLYISLGGNRKGKIRTYVNLMLTMLLGGLWHGASLRFLLWGGLHGFALCLHKFLMSRLKGLKPTSDGMSSRQKILSTILTFNFVAFCWVIFRAESLQSASEMIRQIFTSFQFVHIPEIIAGRPVIFAVIVAAFVFQFLPLKAIGAVKHLILNTHMFEKVIIAVVVFYLAMQLQAEDVLPFIYFQF